MYVLVTSFDIPGAYVWSMSYFRVAFCLEKCANLEFLFAVNEVLEQSVYTLRYEHQLTHVK